jgi:DUF1126 PH-like domain
MTSFMFPPTKTSRIQVLRWFGYFREKVTDSAGEAEQRLRRIVLHFYLENDTVDICEPKQDNSGLLQVQSSFSASSDVQNVRHDPVI